MTVLTRQSAGAYPAAGRPRLPAELAEFVRFGVKQDATAAVKAFRKRLRQLLGS